MPNRALAGSGLASNSKASMKSTNFGGNNSIYDSMRKSQDKASPEQELIISPSYKKIKNPNTKIKIKRQAFYIILMCRQKSAVIRRLKNLFLIRNLRGL